MTFPTIWKYASDLIDFYPKQTTFPDSWDSFFMIAITAFLDSWDNFLMIAVIAFFLQLGQPFSEQLWQLIQQPLLIFSTFG